MFAPFNYILYTSHRTWWKKDGVNCSALSACIYHMHGVPLDHTAIECKKVYFKLVDADPEKWIRSDWP